MNISSVLQWAKESINFIDKFGKMVYNATSKKRKETFKTKNKFSNSKTKCNWSDGNFIFVQIYFSPVFEKKKILEKRMCIKLPTLVP